MAYGSNWNQNQRRIAQQIYSGAAARGLNPNTVLGIASYEGLGKSSPLTWNKDAAGRSFGPFQLYTGPQGGLADAFTRKYGAAPSAGNWNQQLGFVLDYMKSKGTGAWYAVRDQGGINAITAKGAAVAKTLGLTKSTTPGGYETSISAGLPSETPVAAPSARNDGGASATTPETGGGGSTGAQPGGGTNQILSGWWEALGVTAVTTAGVTTAEGVKSASETASKALTESTDKITKTAQEQVKLSTDWGTGTIQDIFSNVKNMFVRGGLLFFGLVMVAGGVLYFSRSSQ